MGEETKSMEPWRPVFLLDDEQLDGQDGLQSIDESAQDKESRPHAGNYLEYAALLSKLRVLTPYRVELESRLGERAHVLDFKGSYSLDSVPNEWKRKEGPLLWKVTFESKPHDGPSCGCPVVGYVTDQELSIFYFRSKEASDSFLGSILGNDTGPSFEETLRQRDNLTRLLG